MKQGERLVRITGDNVSGNASGFYKKILSILLIVSVTFALASPVLAAGPMTESVIEIPVDAGQEYTEETADVPDAEPEMEEYAADAGEEPWSDPMEESASEIPGETGTDSELTAPEEVPEDTESELTGAADKAQPQYLSVCWQDDYMQKIDLGSGLTEDELGKKARSLLKTMGLPEDTYILTVKSDGAFATIMSRDYADGDEEVRVLAHMGYYMTATRNTLSAFRIARALGYHYVGGDVRFTKDNIPVVVHDETINATARCADGSVIDGAVYVRQHTYKELLKYDFGLSTNSVWKGEKIPTLEEYMTLCYRIGLIPNIHIKPDSGLTVSNFRSVAEIVVATGMQGVATYAANYVNYLEPIVAVDPVSIVDIVIQDKWDPHYVTDVLSLKTDQNQVQLGVVKRLLAPNIATTCRYNGILLTTSANSEAEAAALDKHVSMMATDGALPPEIIRGAARRSYHGGDYITADPVSGTDYRLLAHANVGVMMRIIGSKPKTALRLDTEPANKEVAMFRFIKLSNGYYNIISSRNMYAVGIKNGSKADGALLQIADRNTSFVSQMWELVHNDDGSVSFVNYHSGKALSITGGIEKKNSSLCQYTFDGRSSQKFWLKMSDVQIDMKFVGKTIRFQPPGSSIAIATAGNSTAQGARAQTVKYAENNIQKFNLFYSGDGYYRIVNKKTGYCMTNDGDRIVSMRAWDNKDTQRWKLVWNGSGTGLYSGTYRIICKTGSTVLTIDGTVNSLKDIKADPWRGLRQQQWRLTSAG